MVCNIYLNNEHVADSFNINFALEIGHWLNKGLVKIQCGNLFLERYNFGWADTFKCTTLS